MTFKETETIELKKSTSELKEAIISIAAILNKHGRGKIYFGIKNDGTVVGQLIGQKTLREISKSIADHIEPKIFPKVDQKNIKGKSCILVRFEGKDSPYFAFGRSYMRVADEDRQLSIKELENLFISKANSRSEWESEVSKARIGEANIKAIRHFVKRANDVKRMSDRYCNARETLNKLGVIKGSKLLNAGQALFCSDNSIEVQAAVFAGNDKITFLDIQSFHGNLFDLIKTSESYVQEHINWRADLSGSRRVEIPEVPVRAITEAIINSLCHRDFTNPKGNEIAIFKNRVEIYNPGRFPDEHTPEDYIKGDERSILRNPRIANAFYMTSDIERWGSGLKRIYVACQEAGVKVEFKKLKGGFLVIFYRNTELASRNADAKGLGDRLGDRLGDSQKSILELMLHDPKISISAIADKIGISTTGVEKNLHRLKKLKLIRRVGTKKSGHWVLVQPAEK